MLRFCDVIGEFKTSRQGSPGLIPPERHPATCESCGVGELTTAPVSTIQVRIVPLFFHSLRATDRGLHGLLAWLAIACMAAWQHDSMAARPVATLPRLPPFAFRAGAGSCSKHALILHPSPTGSASRAVEGRNGSWLVVAWMHVLSTLTAYRLFFF